MQQRQQQQTKEGSGLDEPMDVCCVPSPPPELQQKQHFEWSPEVDQYLRLLVESQGGHDWVTIAACMNSHFLGCDAVTSKQCRERWCNKLDPSISHAAWSSREEAMLVLSHMKNKNRWCDIVRDLKGRHNNMIKNRFYSIFRKIKNKVKCGDLAYGTQLEVLEGYYMVSVMQDYLQKPVPEEEPKRKRGKDFMFTLISDIDRAELAEYSAKLKEKKPLEGSLEELLQKIVFGEWKIQTPELAHENRTLPAPRTFCAKKGLSAEEKEFVKSQVFPWRDENYAGKDEKTLVVPKVFKPVYVIRKGKVNIKLKSAVNLLS